MKFSYTVNYAGTYYAPGMEVPVGEEKEKVAETPKEVKEEKPVATPKKRTTVKK